MVGTASNSTYFGAFLVFESREVNATTYEFRIDPDRDEWVRVDLTKIPSNVCPPKDSAETCQWSEVEVDAGEEDSATTLTGWSRAGGFRGIIYLSQGLDKFKCYRLPPPGISTLAKKYEFMTLQYSPQDPDSDRAGVRYYGFHARVQRIRRRGAACLECLHLVADQPEHPESLLQARSGPAQRLGLLFLDLGPYPGQRFAGSPP